VYFLGDVHQKYTKLNAILETKSPVVQVGDLGFFYPKWLDDYDFRFLAGNHDNWDVLTTNPPDSYLGRFGFRQYPIPYFFISGAYSIDYKIRLQQEYTNGQKTFWPNEQLSWKEGIDMLDLYGKIKPEVVVSHTCPREVANIIGNPAVLRAFGYDPATFTTSQQELLQQAFEFHQPRLWVLGHMHQSISINVKNTHFRVLSELEIVNYYDLLIALKDD